MPQAALLLSVTVHNIEASTGGFIPTSLQIKGSI